MFNVHQGGLSHKPMQIPCGKCIGCRNDRVEDWATRMVHEAQLHGLNSFLTLTYSDDHVPAGGTLVKRDVQLFIKRLRKAITPRKISYFAAGEYGDLNLRPHYHLVVFGFYPSDTWPVPGQENLYRSPELDKLWGKGGTTVGAVTPESCAYTARYTMKKINGALAAAHYGERIPEFAVMSTRPAIGLNWIKKHYGDTYPSDTIIRRGREATPPPYYDKVLKRTDPVLFEAIKSERKLTAQKPSIAWNQTAARLAVREAVTKSKISLKKRTL